MKKIIILIFAMGMLLRLLGIDSALYNDEAAWGYGLRDNNTYASMVNDIPHLPVALYILKGIASLFNFTSHGFRLTVLLFGIINSLLVYKLAKSEFGEKAAFWALFIMMFAFWPFLASLQVDMEGSILTFFFLSTIYSFLNYERTKEAKWYVISAFLFLAAMLTKLTAVLIPVMLGIYLSVKHKSIVRPVKALLPLALPGLIALFAFSFYLYKALPETFATVLGNAGGGINPERGITLLPLLYFLIWGTPLFAGILITSLLRIKRNYIIFVVWALAIIAFYFFVGQPGIATYDRYYMVALPALSVLGGALIAKAELNAKNIAFGIIIFLISLLLIFLANSNTAYVPHDINNYFGMARNFNWNFFLPLTGAVGPVIGVAFSSLAVITLVALLSLALFLLAGKRPASNYFFVAFVSISLALNAFLVLEYTSSPVYPDVSSVSHQMIDFYNSNSLPKPVYTNQLSFRFYSEFSDDYDVLQRKGSDFVWFPPRLDPRTKEVEEGLRKHGGTVLMLDFPLIDKQGPVWKSINHCSLVRTFESKGKTLGYIYVC